MSSLTRHSILATTILLTCILATFNSYSQDLYLPPLSDLESTLTTFIEIERDAQIRKFDEVKSADWQDALPHVGVAYTPAGDPRPALSWSPLQILDRKEQKKKRRMDRESIYLMVIWLCRSSGRSIVNLILRCGFFLSFICSELSWRCNSCSSCSCDGVSSLISGLIPGLVLFAMICLLCFCNTVNLSFQ